MGRVLAWWLSTDTHRWNDLNYQCIVAERNPPIEEVISQGVIPRFVQFLQRSDLPPLQVW
jgi:hypothetical protein